MVTRDPATAPDLAGYRFVRDLGRGGFSDVFLYEQLLPQRLVAVKVLLADLGPSGMSAFTSEANLMARVSTHPYIVTVHDAGIARDGRPFLVMEYCSRPTLAQAYKARPLSVDDALRTGVRLASAVETAHRAGILHRDIKPGNVLTNDYGWPALTDFGIAAATDVAPSGREGGDPDPEASSGGSVGLSVPWSPPEMFLDIPEHDARSDVFSLTATLFTVLAGRTPFEVPGGPNTAVDLMARIERGEVGALERADVPPSLLAVLRRGMATRREDRFPTALELGRALQRVELELGLAPTSLDIAGSAAPAPAPEGEDAETRVRAVPSVSPDAPVTPHPTPAAPAAPPTDAESGPTRSRLVGILVGVLSLLVVAGVALTVVLTGATVERPETDPAPGGTSGPVVSGEAVPRATGGTATPSADGTEVVVTWTNPEPRDGDVYYWARAETPNDRAVVREPEVVVSGVVPGSRVCVNVEIGRSGRTSEPVAICTE